MNRVISCCHEGCYATITLDPKTYEQLKRTHEWFYCTAGHRQCFVGKTAEEKRIEELEARCDSELERHSEIVDRLYGVVERGSAVARGLQVCPLGCGWHGTRRLSLWGADEEAVGRFLDRAGRDLADHLVDAHNATRAPVALLEAGDPA